MSIFNQFAKDIIASHNGKLNVYPNGFKFSADGVTNINGVHFKAKPDASGRMISLSLNVKTVNGCPKPPEGDWPENEKGRFWIPFSVCRKCPHHIKRRRGQPYPCCALIRELRRKGPTPAEQVAGVFAAAVEKAREVMK